MMTNRSYPTDGTDQPEQDWMQKSVTVPAHPEWGKGRVVRWYPASGDQPARLRLYLEGSTATPVVSVDEVEIRS